MRVSWFYTKNKYMQETFYGFRDVILSISKIYFSNKFNNAQILSAKLNGYRVFAKDDDSLCTSSNPGAAGALTLNGALINERNLNQDGYCSWHNLK